MCAVVSIPYGPLAKQIGGQKNCFNFLRLLWWSILTSLMPDGVERIWITISLDQVDGTQDVELKYHYKSRTLWGLCHSHQHIGWLSWWAAPILPAERGLLASGPLGLFDECELITGSWLWYTDRVRELNGLFTRKIKFPGWTDCWIRKLVRQPRRSRKVYTPGRQHTRPRRRMTKEMEEEKVQQDKWEAIKQARKSSLGWPWMILKSPSLIYIYEGVFEENKKGRMAVLVWGMRPEIYFPTLLLLVVVYRIRENRRLE